jgi:hypothetical protein
MTTHEGSSRLLQVTASRHNRQRQEDTTGTRGRSPNSCSTMISKVAANLNGGVLGGTTHECTSDTNPDVICSETQAQFKAPFHSKRTADP